MSTRQLISFIYLLGTALTRAFNRCVEMGVDLANMSYGEDSKLTGSGNVIEWLRKMIEKHHFLFVTSAGNAGPALSTLGSPAADLDGLIAVGAYIPHTATGFFYGARNQCEENLCEF